MAKETKVSVSIIKSQIQDEKLKEVCCDSKSLFNISMFLLTIGIYLLCFIEVNPFSNINLNFSNIIGSIVICLIVLTPAVYYLLKIFNRKITINKEKIVFQTIFRKKYSYPLEEILITKFYQGVTGSLIEDYFLIKFKDNKSIKVYSSDRNYDQFKNFVIFNEECKLTNGN